MRKKLIGKEFQIFTRNWWRIENGKKVPDSGADKYYIDEADTEKEAREICKEYNESHDAGLLSRKAEYE